MIVPQDYQIDAFWKAATPDEVAFLLDFGAKIRHVFLQKECLQEREARDNMLKVVIGKVIEETKDAANTQIEELNKHKNALEEQLAEKKHLEICHEQLKASFEERITSARNDAVISATSELSAAKLEADTKIFELMTTKCRLVEENAQLKASHCTEISKLQQEISLLQNPLSRGNFGEFDVSQSLRDAGFHVEDTSEGEKKEAGYLDLLVQIDDSTDNMRIAVEVKNKKTIKKASDEKVKKKEKDIDDDIRTFQNRVASGVKQGLFDAAVLVSIRAHTKMGSPVVLEMFDDATNKALAPVSYIGPEKAKNASPITQEQLETHMLMMFSVLENCHLIRRDLCSGFKNEDVADFQAIFEELTAFFNNAFIDLRKQEHLAHDMMTSITNARTRCITMCRRVHALNRATPWLQRGNVPEWMNIYATALERSASMSEADVWNRLSKNKATIEHTIGKDSMFAAMREERNRKRSKNE